MYWYTSAIRTQVLHNGGILSAGTLVQFGHVRNIGSRQWYAEHYRTNTKQIFETLNEAKEWVELLSKGEKDMAKSTADCKQFIADFFKTNPDMICSVYGKGCNPQFQIDATNPKNWKREHKCRPGRGPMEFDEYSVMGPRVQMKNRFGDMGPTTRQMPSQYAWERAFYCDPFETEVAYIVLEDHNGNLFVADYIGD